MLTIGQSIPEFSMETYHLGTVRKLSSTDFKGKWLVVVFYPGDNTFICPTELEEIADGYDRFRALGAEVLSISRDDVLEHQRWHEADPRINKIKYPMGSDEDGTVYKSFGIYTEDQQASVRATYIFDTEGILRSIDTHDNRVGRSTSEILRMLAGAMYVQLHADELCPASCEPGNPTIHLKPGDIK